MQVALRNVRFVQLRKYILDKSANSAWPLCSRAWLMGIQEIAVTTWKRAMWPRTFCVTLVKQETFLFLLRRHHRRPDFPSQKWSWCYVITGACPTSVDPQQHRAVGVTLLQDEGAEAARPQRFGSACFTFPIGRLAFLILSL